MKNTIKFSHDYQKLWGQCHARLIEVNITEKKHLHPDLIEYDTNYGGGYYKLPDGKLIQLVFLGDKGIPFCTIRRWTPEKEKYYQSQIGKIFIVEVKP